MRVLFIVIFIIIGSAFFFAIKSDDFITSRAVLEDQAGVLSIEEIGDMPFQPVGFILSKGYTDSIHWLRITVRARDDAGELVLRIRPNYLDEITLFEQDTGVAKGWKTHVTGDRIPFMARERATLTLGFLIKPAKANNIYYLRLKTTSASIMNVQALSPHDAEIRDLQLNLLQFLYLGILLGFLFLAINDYITNHDEMVGWLVFYQCIYLIYNIFILGYIAPLIPFADFGLVDISTSFIILLMTLVSLVFNKKVINLFEPNKLILRVFIILIIASPIDLIIMLLGYTRLALQINALLVLLAAPMLVFLAFSARHEAAPGRRLLRAMYVIGVISLLISMLALLGWIEATEWKLQIMFLNGIISTLLMFLLLHFRSIKFQKEGEQAKFNLVLVEESLKIEQLQRQKENRFMAMLNHEIKTPLSVIRMTLGMQEITAADKYGAQKSVLDIDAIVDRCLQADQLDQKKFTLKLQKFRLDELLAEVCTASASPQKLELKCDIQPEMHTDLSLLRIIVNNLIDNALKYAKPRSIVHIHVVYIEHKNKKGVQIDIINQPGTAGMPDAQRVFSKYYRSPGAHNKTGSGLGLYLVQGMIELLGGWVCYNPTQNEVKFELWIPI